jgi:hypothetical protein
MKKKPVLIAAIDPLRKADDRFLDGIRAAVRAINKAGGNAKLTSGRPNAGQGTDGITPSIASDCARRMRSGLRSGSARAIPAERSFTRPSGRGPAAGTPAAAKTRGRWKSGRNFMSRRDSF